MISSVNSLSSSSISLLFGVSGISAVSSASATQQSPGEATGFTDDVLKTGNAIGNIIAIVAGMKASESVGAFTMDGAQRTDNADGSYTMKKTGTGTVVSDQEFLNRALERAKGTDAGAARTRSYLAAMADGTLQTRDMSTMGVTSTLTQTNFHEANGRISGSMGRYDTKGMDQFLEKYVIIKDGEMFDKETGKNAGIGQNGTKFTYSV